jgi:hypothetical protein
MQQLYLHPEPCCFVDATPAPPTVARRVSAVLEKKVFKVESAAFEGMEHLQQDSPPLDTAAATELAAEKGLKGFMGT